MRRGAKASTDLTHWPKATAAGARVSRITLGPRGLATGAVWLDHAGVEHHQEADVVILAANSVGTARLLLLSADDRRCPDGLANSSCLVGRRLMMHPFSVVTGWWDDQVEGWQGHFGASITSYQFYETDSDRGFVRGAKWALSPVGGPSITSCPCEPVTRCGVPITMSSWAGPSGGGRAGRSSARISPRSPTAWTSIRIAPIPTAFPHPG